MSHKIVVPAFSPVPDFHERPETEHEYSQRVQRRYDQGVWEGRQLVDEHPKKGNVIEREEP